MTIQSSDLYRLQKKDFEKAGIILSEAFKEDPVWNAVFENEINIDKKSPYIFQMPVRFSKKYGEVYATSSNLEGIIGWVTGAKAFMNIWRIIRSGGFRIALKTGSSIGKKMNKIFSVIENDRKLNMKNIDYFYIQILGVSPEFQNRGFGGKLLEYVIKEAEKGKKHLYLETETEKNVKFYEKYDFQIVKKVTLPYIELPMWEMIRIPK